MSAEQLPEPPRDNEYTRCLLAEHSQDIEFWYVGDKEHDVIAGMEKFLYRHNYPYRHIAKKLGGFALGYLAAAGRAMCALPSPEQLADTPPLDS